MQPMKIGDVRKVGIWTRFEYRMIDGKDDYMRYRKRLRLRTG